MATLGVRVDGLRQVQRSLERLGVEAADMRDAMQRIGALVAGTARTLVPRRRGRLAATIRPGRAKGKATVRAGSAAVPYAGPIHWGWPARNIAAQPFLVDALERDRRRVRRMLDDELGRLISRLDLKNVKG